MAIVIDKDKIKDIKNPVRRKEKKQYIGLKLPLGKSEGSDGYFESTDTSLDATKENIRNLILTRKGERVMNPSLGLNLDEFLFENITEDVIYLIREDLQSTFKFWLPFVGLNDLDISSDSNTNTINIQVKFYMRSNPSQIESVQVEI
jgi:phage baseplate assembly protein W